MVPRLDGMRGKPGYVRGAIHFAGLGQVSVRRWCTADQAVCIARPPGWIPLTCAMAASIVDPAPVLAEFPELAVVRAPPENCSPGSCPRPASRSEERRVGKEWSCRGARSSDAQE